MDNLERIQKLITDWKLSVKNYTDYEDIPELQPDKPEVAECVIDKILQICMSTERCFCGNEKTATCKQCGMDGMCPEHNDPEYCWHCN